ncbi:MAG: polysaccharide biosynthesis protein [Oscillospiraceae bacterium]|nr:polysaccharide biosynthesis protein [Oscillospiraceae bacterium]
MDMERDRGMFLNTILLTASSFLMRATGMALQVFLSRRIGAAGLGLMQLITSVSTLAATFAVSGIRFAATRLVAEELSRSGRGGVRSAVRRCLIYAACFGLAAAAILFFGARIIGERLVGNGETVLPLRILAFSMPLISTASVFSGYFTAVCRIVKTAAVQLTEQLFQVAAVIAALSLIGSVSAEVSCAVIVACGAGADLLCLFLHYILYRRDRLRYPGESCRGNGLTRRLLGISLPLALSTYARTALSTVQHLLIPRGYQKYGMTEAEALASYGTVSGMVFPIILFPSALFYALADLLVPELTRAQVLGQAARIRRVVSRTLRLCLLFSFCVAAVLFRFSGELGTVVYRSAEVGRYVRLMAPIMPIMYLDSVTDGMLRGLGEHMYTMRVNLIDSAVSLVMVILLLPRFAVYGYLFMVASTEICNFALSIARLIRVSGLRPCLLIHGKAILCAAGAVELALLLLRTLGLPLEASTLSLVLHITLTAALYVPLLTAAGCIPREDADWVKTLIKGR